MRGLFLAGTDTGCGKTTVGTVLAHSARERGMRVRVLKPVETGCELRGGEPFPADAAALAAAAADPSPLERVCPYRLRLPAAPGVAAQHEGVEIDPERIETAYARAAAEADLVIVEGAGGLLVPVCEGLDMAGLARRLGLGLVVVARAALGTINHTLLTLEAARARGLAVHGVAISHTVPDAPEGDRANLELLRKRLPAPLLGELPYGADALVPPVAIRTLLGAPDRA